MQPPRSSRRYQEPSALAQHAHLGQALLVAPTSSGMRLGDDVLVLDRDRRDVEPDHGAGLAGEVAGGADHVLAGDVALVGLAPATRRAGFCTMPVTRVCR